MDPAMMGGMPPMPPPPPPGGGGGDIASLTAKMDQLMQLMQGGGIGAQSGANQAGMLKPKIDINVEILKMNKILARIADALGVHIPAYEMVATPQDLTSMANQQQSTGQQDAAMGGAIPPMGGMSGMQGSGAPGQKQGQYQEYGQAYRDVTTDMDCLHNKAAALRLLYNRRRKVA